MKKILWFDCETTGVDSRKNDPVQIAGLVDYDGEIVDEFNILCQPINYNNVSQKALEIQGVTLEQIKERQDPVSAKRKLQSVFTKHIDKFNSNDKFYPAGYNVRFDIDFLSEWFRKQNDKYIGSFWNWRAIDPLQFLHVMAYRDELFTIPNLKLETVCHYYGIEIDAHDALSDIKATRELAYRMGMFEDSCFGKDPILCGGLS